MQIEEGKLLLFEGRGFIYACAGTTPPPMTTVAGGIRIRQCIEIPANVIYLVRPPGETAPSEA